jgi:hypothetical protein
MAIREPSSRRPGAALAAAILVLLAPPIGGAEVRTELARSIRTVPEEAARAASAAGGEAVRMHWKLGGFLGPLAGLFVPSRGEATLTFVPSGEETEITLLVTSSKREGEYLLYGASVAEATGAVRSVWSSQKIRDKMKQREQVIERTDLVDYASVIYRLRWRPPDRPSQVTIWSDGKIYPADVEPLGPSTRKISGEKIEVRGYSVRGAKIDGKRAFKDRIQVYFARDATATPVEIVGGRGFINVRMSLAETHGTPRPPRSGDTPHFPPGGSQRRYSRSGDTPRFPPGGSQRR